MGLSIKQFFLFLFFSFSAALTRVLASFFAEENLILEISYAFIINIFAVIILVFVTCLKEKNKVSNDFVKLFFAAFTGTLSSYSVVVLQALSLAEYEYYFLVLFLIFNIVIALTVFYIFKIVFMKVIKD